jgi:hypothetical protein
MSRFEMLDKKYWGDGPWQHEPDELYWPYGDAACAIRRNSMGGSLNGYVAVSASHPWYEHEYEEIENHICVHGGLTFAGHLRNMPETLWWFGFDTAHAGDYLPAPRLAGIVRIGVYRDINYLTAETERLAHQLINAAKEHNGPTHT